MKPNDLEEKRKQREYDNYINDLKLILSQLSNCYSDLKTQDGVKVLREKIEEIDNLIKTNNKYNERGE